MFHHKIKYRSEIQSSPLEGVRRGMRRVTLLNFPKITLYLPENQFRMLTSSSLNLAYQDPSYGGTAVFSARVMLGIDVENTSTKRSANSLVSSASVSENFVRFFPNPAREYVNYEVTLEPIEIAQLEIFDLFGRIVFAKTLNYDTKTGFIDFRGKSNGVYTYKVKLKNRLITGKIVLE